MALETLLASLAREAEDEAAALVAAARERRGKALAEAESAATARRAARLEARERDLRAAATLVVEDERRVASRRELEVRAELLARVLARARETLPLQLGERRVRSLLASLVVEVLDDLGGERAVVRSSPALADALAERLAGREGVAVVADDRVGSGARVVLGDGAFEIDVTLESQLARMRSRLTSELAREIAGERP